MHLACAALLGSTEAANHRWVTIALLALLGAVLFEMWDLHRRRIDATDWRPMATVPKVDAQVARVIDVAHREHVVVWDETGPNEFGWCVWDGENYYPLQLPEEDLHGWLPVEGHP
jgi:hypothetical protein